MTYIATASAVINNGCKLRPDVSLNDGNIDQDKVIKIINKKLKQHNCSLWGLHLV